MWDELSRKRVNEYKKLILGFASLSQMFSQKAENDDGANQTYAPIINTKYQETVFGRTFGATIEDIGNTSYDASLEINGKGGKTFRYLIGIKTFGIGAGKQKVAQFKGDNAMLSAFGEKARKNAVNEDGSPKTKEEINVLNHDLYMDMAKELARLRNNRIRSHKENIKGFHAPVDQNVEIVYHVLMPSKKGQPPKIYVGETTYTEIDESSIRIIGCTAAKNPSNFTFADKNHEYSFSMPDSQLYMDFHNKEIVVEEWDVKYADDPFAVFSEFAESTYKDEEITEDYIWPLTNKNGETEPFSGLNSFFGVGSKMGVSQRDSAIKKLRETFRDSVDSDILEEVVSGLKQFLLTPSPSSADKAEKVRIRQKIIEKATSAGVKEFSDRVKKMLYRPVNETYIPIPDARNFHKEHPDFFAKNAGRTKADSSSLALPPNERRFNLVFEPSGEFLSAYISQDNGKAIESCEKQSFLGNWILRGIFQLAEYEPLTRKKMDEIGINGVHLYRTNKDDNVHIEFIWIDS